MMRIHERCGDVMAAAVSGCSLPVEFLAALTANESGGEPEASCFEHETYLRLKAVATGSSAEFGRISERVLFAALQQHTTAAGCALPERLAATDFSVESLHAISRMEDEGLRALATSWGLTQIMGYHVVGRAAAVHQLLDPQFHYRFAVDLLTEFAHRFRLSLSTDFEALFRCWNTGRPDGETFDRNYVCRGIRRAQIYRDLLSSTISPLAGAE